MYWKKIDKMRGLKTKKRQGAVLGEKEIITKLYYNLI